MRMKHCDMRTEAMRASSPIHYYMQVHTQHYVKAACNSLDLSRPVAINYPECVVT